MTVDLPDWMPDSQAMVAAWLGVTSQIAALIATGQPNGQPGGVPLLTFNNLLDQQINYVIPHGGNYTSPVLTVDQIAYDIVIENQIGAGSAEPWLQVQFVWMDTSIGLASVVLDTWYLACPNVNITVSGGRGLTKGNQLKVIFTNLDTVASVTFSYGITQHSRVVSRDDIRNLSFEGAPGYTLPVTDPSSNTLALWNPTIAAGNNATIILPIFSGKARLSVPLAPAACRVIIRAPAEIPGASALSDVIYDSGNVAASGVLNDDIVLPRSNCSVELINSGASSQTFNLAVIAEEY